MKYKYVLLLAFLAGLAFPAFSQDANKARFQALKDQMDRTLSSSNTKLENYNQDANTNGNTATYASYRGKYNSLVKALSDSEAKLDLLIRTNDRNSKIKAERDHYESLVKKLQSLKSDYDTWLGGVK